MSSRNWVFFVFLIVGFVAIIGCGLSPEEKKARHLKRGDAYIGEEKYREAIIEYRNVLQIEQDNIHAVEQIGYALFNLGEMQQAYRYLMNARELNPNNPEVRIKLGMIYLLARELENAREEAETILRKDPGHVDALLLYAGSADTPKEVDVSIELIKKHQLNFKDQTRYFLALGNLYLKKENMEAAENAYKEALNLNPISPEAHTALGNLYLAKKDSVKTEAEFKIAADLAPVESKEQIKLADFFLLVNKPEQAKKHLTDITRKAPEFTPATRRLALISFAEKKYDEAAKIVDKTMEKYPSDPESLFLRGRIHLAEGRTDKAIKDFQKVVQLNPGFLQGHYQLALAYLQKGNTEAAEKEFKEVLTINPEFAKAIWQLAELDIKTGNPLEAVDRLKKFIQKHPKVPVAHVLLGAAYMAAGEIDNSVKAYQEAVFIAPNNPQGLYLFGMALERKGNHKQARKQFERSLEVSPEYLKPLVRLVKMDLEEKKADKAIERIQAQIVRTPDTAGLHYLLGKAYMAKEDFGKAETSMKKAIEMNPNFSDAYGDLGRIYWESGKAELAMVKFKEALSRNPKDVKVLMITGIIEQFKGNISQARHIYEKILNLNSDFIPAVNNLAYIYSEFGGDLEKAFRLALQANKADPDDPGIVDTLGWILYKQGDYRWAHSLLKESASRLRDNPEVLYHLGMVQYKLGKEKEARTTLGKAVGISDNFRGVEGARKMLEGMR